MKKMLLILILLPALTFIGNIYCYADNEQGGLGDVSWTAEPRGVDRFFYFTHSTAVWGDEFGFFINKNDCTDDTLWLTLSSSDEKVKKFEGKDVGIVLNVDGHDFKIHLPMLYTNVIGLTSVMMFTNLSPGNQLMIALISSRYVKARITEPKELVDLLDIKEEQFGLQGLEQSREKARAICKG